MSAPAYYHGGVGGLSKGDLLVPSPPHIEDGCPICVARASGRVVTAGQLRRMALRIGPRAKPLLDALEGAPDDAPIDPPTEQAAVYITPVLDYALWHAARSRGDLYRVEPVGDAVRSTEDTVPSFTASRARVVEVVRRCVTLERRDRRRIQRLWAKADRKAFPPGCASRNTCQQTGEPSSPRDHHKRR